jgi:hypothetical protein
VVSAALRDIFFSGKTAFLETDLVQRHRGRQRAGRFRSLPPGEILDCRLSQQASGTGLPGAKLARLVRGSSTRRHPESRLEAGMGSLPGLPDNQLPGVAVLAPPRVCAPGSVHKPRARSDPKVAPKVE